MVNWRVAVFLVVAVLGLAIAPREANATASIIEPAFCVDADGFEFDVGVSSSEAVELIVRIGADGPVFSGDGDRIAVNFDSTTGAITRQDPEVESFGGPLDRWVDGLIADATLTNVGTNQWRFAGSVAHGADAFAPGDVITQVGVRSVVGDAFLSNVPIAACDGGDTNPPTWDGAALVADPLTATSVTLTWPAASDDVGVDRYEVSQDGSLVTTVRGVATSVTIGSLQPDTTYVFAVTAFDAAGNSALGPSVTVTTLGQDDVGHVGPDPGSTSLMWTQQLPYSAAGQARRLGQAVLVASTGTTSPVVTTLDLEVPVDVDIDSDGTPDVTATLRLAPGVGLIPGVEVEVNRLAAPGLSDVEILALFPLEDPTGSTDELATVIAGYRTVDADGNPGGYLPQREVIGFSVDTIGGLDHRLLVEVATDGAPNPLQFFFGGVESDDISRALAANVVAMLVDDVPSAIEVGVSISISDPTGVPEVSLSADWQSPDTEPRPNVALTYLESERRPATIADGTITASFEPIAPEQSITLRYGDAVQDEQLVIFGSERNDRIDVEYLRSDGFRITGAATDVNRRLAASFTTSGDIELETNGRLNFEVDVEHPGHDLLGGALTNPVSRMFASLKDTTSVVVGIGWAPGGATFEVDTSSSYSGDLVVVLADDFTDLVFPAGQVWPSGAPETWDIRSASRVQFGLVDGAEGTTVAGWISNVQNVQVDLSATTLGQLLSFTPSRSSRIDAAFEIDETSPLAPGSRAEARCRATTPQTAPVSVDVQPGAVEMRSGGLRNVDCGATAGDILLGLTADTLPASFVVDYDVATGTEGSITVRAADADGSEGEARDFALQVRDPNGLTDAELLGAPVQHVLFRSAGLVSTGASWSRGDVTQLTVESLAIEDETDLEVLLATTDLGDPLEGDVPRPQGFNADLRRFSRQQPYFRLWETPEMTLLGGRAASMRSAQLWFDPSDGSLAVDLQTRRASDLGLEVFVPERGHFSGALAVNGGCVPISLPADGFIEAVFAIPDRVTLTSVDAQVGGAECDVIVTSEGASDFSIRALVSVEAFPPHLDVVHRTGRSIAVTATGADVGMFSVEARDLTGDGLPGPGWPERPFRSMGFRVDEAPSSTVGWSVSGGRVVVSASTRNVGDVIGAVQAKASTASSITLPDPTPFHEISIDDQGPDGEVEVGIVLRSLRNVTAVAQAQTGSLVTVGASFGGSPRPMQLVADLDFDSTLTAPVTAGGLQIQGLITLRDVRGVINVTTDLDTNHSITVAPGPVNATIRATIDDDPADDDDGNRTCSTGGLEGPEDATDEPMCLYGQINGIPNTITLNTDAFYDFDLADGHAFFDAGGTVDLVDLVLRHGREGGVFDTGADRIRIRAEQVPLSLDFNVVDAALRELDDGSVVLDGRLAVTGRTGGTVGSLMVFATAEESTLFSTPYRLGYVRLESVPANWTFALEADADTGEMTAGGAFSGPVIRRRVPTDVGLGNLSVVLAEDVPDEPITIGTFLDGFAEPTQGVVDRSAYTKSLDDAYWPAGVRWALDNTFGRPVRLNVTTQALPQAPDLAPRAFRRLASDHAILVGPTGEWHSIALSISDLRQVTFAATANERTIEVVRPRRASAGPLFVGMQEVTIPHYETPDSGIDPTEGDPGGPDFPKYGVIQFDYETGPTWEIGIVGDGITIEIPFGALFGTLEVLDTGRLRYTARSATFVGRDEAFIRVCDAEGRCSPSLLTIEVAEFYERRTIARVGSQPERIVVTLNGVTADDDTEAWDLRSVTWNAGSSLGTGDFASLPVIPPPVTPVATVRLWSPQLPTAGKFDASSLPKIFPGKFKLDTESVFEFFGVIENGADRTAFGVRGEDAELEIEIDGLIADLIVDAETDNFPPCDRIIVVDTCIALIKASIEGDFEGDVTKARLSGFFGQYIATETADNAPPAAGDIEFVPRFTAMLGEARDIIGGFELQFDPLCIFCAFRPLEIEAGLFTRVRSVEIGLWPLAMDFCVGDDDVFCSFPAQYLAGRPIPIVVRNGGFDPLAGLP